MSKQRRGWIRVAWFQKRKRSANLLRVIDSPTPSTAPILDGDENAATPVEEANLGKLARLQPFSPVAISLLRLFDRDDADMNEIVRLVQSDAAIAAETLAYVNSPLFALRESITDLHHAIAVLGADRVKNLATTLAMRAMLKSAPKTGVVRRLWQHSIATAVIASELAPIYGVKPDLANTAGLLHDLGRMALLAQYGEDYAHLVLRLHDSVEAVLQAERDLCELDHCDAGAYLGQVWKLPKVFQEVASGHHEAEGATGILGAIHTACAMADDMTFSAVSHRGVLTLKERVAKSVPEALRKQVEVRLAGAEQRIRDKVGLLDF
jgi:putative nucleotidyltransferase with HDIG domain